MAKVTSWVRHSHSIPPSLSDKLEVSFACEMVPFVPGAKVTLLRDDGQPLGGLTTEPREARTGLLDRGGFGVRVELEKPIKMRL